MRIRLGLIWWRSLSLAAALVFFGGIDSLAVSHHGPAAGATVIAPPALTARLHPKWRLVTTKLNDFAADDRYVAVIQPGGGRTDTTITLIDQQTHVQWALAPPGCAQPSSPQFGGPYLLVVCTPSSYELYQLHTGQWSELTPPCSPETSPLLGGAYLLLVCSASSYDLYKVGAGQWSKITFPCRANLACRPTGIGTYWISFVETDPTCLAHCGGGARQLENIQTSTVTSDPEQPGGRVYDDLDAPSGSRPLCSPLRYPGHVVLEQGTEPGRLMFLGQFVLTMETYYDGRAFGLAGSNIHLRRCGSRFDLRLGGPFVQTALANPHVVVWQDASQATGTLPVLRGRFLPSLRRFRVDLPQHLAGGQLYELSRRTIYVDVSHHRAAQQLWAAELPG